MYDPVLGRFIQADSIVQDPYDPQSLNRYAYVLNNPLTATDPSGNISFKNGLRLVVAIAITVYTGGAASSLLLAGTINGLQAVAIVAAGGALSGLVSGGGLKGALRGAFTAAVFFGVGQGATALQGAKGSLSHAAFANNGLGRAALHGIAGGALASLQGGNFGHAFATAGIGKAITSNVPQSGNDYADGALAALVGGTISEATGEGFSNGALTGAMQFAFNQLVNQAAGEAVRNEVVARIQNALTADGIPGKVLKSVSLSVTQSNGRVVTAIADYAYRVGDDVVFGEVKSGFSSKFSFNQKLVYAAISEGRVSITSASAAERLGLALDKPFASGEARFVTHAAEGSRAARQFGRLFAGRGGSALELLGKRATTTFKVVGSATFSTVTLFLETNSVSAMGALRDDCPVCSPGAVSKVQ